MLNNDFQKLGVTGLITLYQLDASNVGAGVFYFHGHNDGDIIWQGKTYHAVAITADGLEMRGDGKASTPTLNLANVFNGIVGGLSALCLQSFIRWQSTLTDNRQQAVSIKNKRGISSKKLMKTTAKSALNYQILWTLKGKKFLCAKSLVIVTGRCAVAIAVRSVATWVLHALPKTDSPPMTLHKTGAAVAYLIVNYALVSMANCHLVVIQQAR